MARFVILHHVLAAESPRPSHWDFMLEWPGALRTWALDMPPSSNQEIHALQLEDHRPIYLTYEGPVSGDRGHVTRLDGGEYQLISSDDCGMVLELRGSQLRGVVRLQKCDPHGWVFTFSECSPSGPTGHG
jgi:hypothetical protein